MNPSDSYCRLSSEALLAFTAGCFRAAGMAAEDAELGARALVRAELRGVATHGVNRLPGYARALRAGRMSSRPQVRVAQDMGASLLIDGDRGLGHVVSSRAMAICIERARERGAAF